MKWPWGTAKPRVGNWEKKPSTHAADRNSAPAVLNSARTHGGGDVVDVVAPPPRLVRVPSAEGDEATPIFDSVMYDREWDSLPATAMTTKGSIAGTAVVYRAEEMRFTNPPVDIQFEVAFILDLERQDMDAVELDKWEDEIAYDAMVDVDFGWGDHLDFQPKPIPLLPVDQWMTDRGLARSHA